jgi:hypothetical protein
MSVAVWAAASVYESGTMKTVTCQSTKENSFIALRNNVKLSSFLQLRESLAYFSKMEVGSFIP